jgi:O-antigen ligase
MGPTSSRIIQSTILDFLVIALLYSAAIAWGAKMPWGMSFFSAASILLCAYILIMEAAGGRVRFYFSWTYIPALGLLALATLQRMNPVIALDSPSPFLPYTVEPHTTELYLILAVGYAALGLAVVHGFSTRQQLVRFVVLMILLGIMESLYGLFQNLTGFTSALDPPFHSDSAHGTLANRNHYALMLNFSISLGVGFLYRKSADLFQGRKLRVRHLLGMPDSAQLAWIIVWLALIGLGVIMSLSRAGIIAMFVCVGVMMIAARLAEGGRFAPILVLSVAFAIVGLGIFTGIDAVLARYAGMMHHGYFEQDRIPIWRDSWRMIHSNPWFGQGVGSFQWTFPAYETWEPDRPAVYAHNDYLQILAECGVAGLVLVVWLLIACWRRAWHNLRSEDSLVRGIGVATLGALTAAAIQEMTDYALYTPAVTAMLICIVALNEKVARSQRQEETMDAVQRSI